MQSMTLNWFAIQYLLYRIYPWQQDFLFYSLSHKNNSKRFMIRDWFSFYKRWTQWQYWLLSVSVDCINCEIVIKTILHISFKLRNMYPNLSAQSFSSHWSIQRVFMYSRLTSIKKRAQCSWKDGQRGECVTFKGGL